MATSESRATGAFEHVVPYLPEEVRGYVSHKALQALITNSPFLGVYTR